eukprot:7254663-Pyramimonas_sp.AAC.1
MVVVEEEVRSRGAHALFLAHAGGPQQPRGAGGAGVARLLTGFVLPARLGRHVKVAPDAHSRAAAIKQSIHPSINQSINQPIARSFNQSMRIKYQ